MKPPLYLHIGILSRDLSTAISDLGYVILNTSVKLYKDRTMIPKIPTNVLSSLTDHTSFAQAPGWPALAPLYPLREALSHT